MNEDEIHAWDAAALGSNSHGRVEKKERQESRGTLGLDVELMTASVNPTGIFGTRMALQSCPSLVGPRLGIYQSYYASHPSRKGHDLG